MKGYFFVLLPGDMSYIIGLRQCNKSMMSKATFKSALFLAISLSIWGCSSINYQIPGALPEGKPRYYLDDLAYQSLQLRILSRSMGYALGSPFDMKMRLTNSSGETIVLEFPEGRAFDFFVYQKDNLIYRYSEDTSYPTGLHRVVLQPGESKEFGGIWLCRDRNGKWVRGGRYQLIGMVNTDPPIISDVLLFGLAD